MAMMLIGLGGLAFHMFKTDGWVSQITGQVFAAGTSNPVIVVPVGIAAVVLAWASLNGRLVVGKEKNKVGDMLVFAIVFTGIYFTYSWLSAGP